jgi:hypothetical protein
VSLEFIKWNGGRQGVILKEIRGNVTYIGTSDFNNASPSQPVWKIFREATISEGVTRSEWANNLAEQVFIWDSRVSYFTPLTSINDELASPNKGTTYTLINGVSMSANISGSEIDVSLFENWSVQLVWTGAPVGVVSIKASVDGATFTDIPGTSQSTAGEAGSHTINFGGNGHKKIMPVFTRTSGTGVLTATAVGN